MNQPSDLTTSLIVPEEKVKTEIGDIRVGADLAYAEKLLAGGIKSKDDIAPWGAEIETVTKEIRRIEKVRDFFLEPIKQAKAAVEAARKKQSAMFDGPIAILQAIKDRLAGPYGQFVLKCKQEDDAKALAEQETARKKAVAEAPNDFMAQVAEAEVMSEPLKPATTKVKTPTGSTSMRFLDRVRVLELSKVPREYLMFDEEKALADFKAGKVKEIPGLEFYKEPKPWVR